MAYPATPKTWVAGDVLTAAQLNAELRDALLAAFPLSVNAWPAYTPTLVQSGTVTKTVNSAAYSRIGRTIHFRAILTVTGGSPVAGNVVKVGLPVIAAISANQVIGYGTLYDASAALVYRAIASTFDTDELSLSPANSTVADSLGVTGFTAALAVGDIISVSGTYEAAT